MTDEEYYGKMSTLPHKRDCFWHWDQYWWECDCGAVPVAELLIEERVRAGRRIDLAKTKPERAT